MLTPGEEKDFRKWAEVFRRKGDLRATQAMQVLVELDRLRLANESKLPMGGPTVMVFGPQGMGEVRVDPPSLLPNPLGVFREDDGQAE